MPFFFGMKNIKNKRNKDFKFVFMVMFDWLIDGLKI